MNGGMTMADRLAGKTALVTGATGSLGGEIARALATEGALVAGTGRDSERGAALVDEITAAGGRAVFVEADLDGSEAASRDLASRATEALGGRVDILVNNAGIFPGDRTPDTDEKAFDRVFGVNVKAPFFLVAALAPAMAERGDGAIVNLGSWVARLGLPRGALYASTKGALETLTRAWAAEFGPRGVRVNAISPGTMLSTDDTTIAEMMMAGTPANVGGPPDAIGASAVYLASDEARFVHAATLDVDGGRVNAAVIAGGGFG
jgi:NAD(P)-dependent dehydrogenase (short-subunit alcohol dehydrogenase family)